MRNVTTDGIINIFAGDGYKGYYGDAGQANVAGLTGPQDVAIGPKGIVPDRRYRQCGHPPGEHRRHDHHRLRATAPSESRATAWPPSLSMISPFGVTVGFRGQ